MRILVVLLISAFCTCAVHAQRYSFINYTTQNGLVQSNITDIKQDKSGNIWIGTKGGLSIFDGKKFTNFDDRSVLQSLEILSIHCDSAGLVWLATGNGLLCYEHSFRVIFQPKDSILARVWSLTAYGRKILFICNRRIYEVLADHTVKPLAVNGKVENDAEFVSYDTAGNLWIITNAQRVYRFTGGKLREFLKPAFIDQEYSNSFGFIRINAETGGEPYFVSNFGMLYVSGDTLGWFNQKYPQFFDASTGAPTFVYKDGDSVTWVGATRGLVKMSRDAPPVRIMKENGFGNHSVAVIMRDRESNLWVGSTYYGVYRLSNEALFSLLTPPNVDFRNISYTTAINDSTAIIGTWGTGPFLLKNNRFVQMNYISPPMHDAPGLNYITSVCHVGNVTYICSLEEGLFRVADGSTHIYHVPLKERASPLDNIVRYQNKFIIQNQDGATFLYDDSFRMLKQADTAMGMIRFVNGKLYHSLAISNMQVIDSNFHVVKRKVFPEILSEVSEIVGYKDKVIVSTLGDGLFIYDSNDKLVARINKQNGLNTNVVTGLLVDGDVLFFGTNYGMAVADLKTLKVRLFNEKEGMFTAECRRQGLLRLSAGKFLIATTSGPYVYYPQKDNTATLARAYVHLSSFSTEGSERKTELLTPVHDHMKLREPVSFSRNDVTIAFKGVSQRAPNDIVYHYRLKGLADSAWKSSPEDGDIQYLQLPAGDYVFSVYATVKGYISPVSSLSFSISKPLQSEWWFQLMILLLIAVFFLFLLNFLNRLYQKYVQTKMIDEIDRNARRKNAHLAEAVHFAKEHLHELNQSHYKQDELDVSEINFMYANAEFTRLESYLTKENISLGEFHQYLGNLQRVGEGEEPCIYHDIADDNVTIPMEKAFRLMEVFGLYITWKHAENPHFLFTVASELRSNNRLLIRCYHLNSLRISIPSALEGGFRKMLRKMKDENWMVSFIENPGTSSMLIVELEIVSS